MRQQISILPLGPHEYAAFVDVGDDMTSYHHLLIGPEFLREVGLAQADEELVAFEVMAHLLQVSSRVPELLQLTTYGHLAPTLVPELRARLGATA